MKEYWGCSVYDESGEEKELRCPKCGCSHLVFEEDPEDYTDMPDYFGKKATCFECGHEFTVTENCWEIVNDECS